MQLLQSLARKMPQNTDALEVGSWKGRSSICIASVLKEGQYLHAIDTFRGSQEHHHLYGKAETYEDFIKNISDFQLREKILIHKGTSLDAKRQVDKKIALVFIDGSHDYQDVLLDYQTWFPKLESGGYIAFHDAKWPGVKKVLWQNLYQQKNLSPIRRIEDTVYAKKLASDHLFYYLWNQGLLLKEKAKQIFKRYRRRFIKKIKKRKQYV